MRIASAQDDVSRPDAAAVAARLRARSERLGARRAEEHEPDAVRANSGCGRRRRDSHGLESGADPRRLRSARDGNCRRALAMGGGGRGRPGHHRRRDARRQRFRFAAAHQADAAGSADHRHERAEHVHDRDQGLGARRLRISAQALRSARTGRHRRPGARGAQAPPRGAGRPCAGRGDADRRPLARPCRTSSGCSRG